MPATQLLATLDKIEQKILNRYSAAKRLWFLRTDGGNWFDDFSENNFVAIGWPKLKDLNEFDTQPSAEAFRKAVCEKIQSLYEEAVPGYVYTQRSRFDIEMQVGDHVIIPGTSSHQFLFGEIRSNPKKRSDIQNISPFQSEFSLCRDVQWVESFRRSQIKGEFHKSVYSQNTIQDVTLYADEIYRLVFPVVIDRNKTSFNFNIERETNVPAIEFFQFSELLPLFDWIGSEFNFGSSASNLDVKVVLQSPGSIQFSAVDSGARRALIILAILLSSCSNSQDKLDRMEIEAADRDTIIQEISNSYQAKIESLKKLQLRAEAR